MQEKYPNKTPYHYCSQNPVNLVDPNGMDDYIFDQDGNYTGKLKKEGEHKLSLKRIEVTETGYEIIHFDDYNFADPINDPSDIEDGFINRVTILSQADIEGIIESQGGFNTNDSSYGNIFVESFPGGAFDYSGKPLDSYMKGESLGYSMNSLFIAEGDTYAHNNMNFGNFLWGGSGYSLGVSESVLHRAAHTFSFFTAPLYGLPLQGDSTDDQLSISRGIKYAKDNDFRSKRK